MIEKNNCIGKKYENPPIVEALCEIYFIDSKWDSTIPGMFYDKIKEEYPIKKELRQVGIEIALSPQTQRQQINKEKKRMQFIKKDNSRMIQVEKNLLVVNQLKPYPEFESWKPVVDQMLKIYEELARPKGICRVGMRYINRININEPKIQMEDYYHIYPEVPEALGSEHGNFMMRLEIPPKHKGHMLVVTFGSAPPAEKGGLAQMLDIYDICRTKELFDNSQADAKVVEAHENIERAFENAITQKCRDMFVEKGENK